MVHTESWHCGSGQDSQPIGHGGSAWGVPPWGTTCLQQVDMDMFNGTVSLDEALHPPPR